MSGGGGEDMMAKKPVAGSQETPPADPAHDGKRGKLTEEQVQQIRAHPDADIAELAKMFGVSEATIRKVLRGETWKNIK